MPGSNIHRATAGFITSALSVAGLVIFVFWSILPEHVLHYVGFGYYPNRYWSVAAPSIFLVLFSYFLFFHFCSYMRNVKPLDDMFQVTDLQSKQAARDTNPLGNNGSTTVRPLCDISVAMSSLVLHQPWPAMDAE